MAPGILREYNLLVDWSKQPIDELYRQIFGKKLPLYFATYLEHIGQFNYFQDQSFSIST